MNRLIIVGAGGHGKVIADTAVKLGYTEICFVDDNVTESIPGFPVIGTTGDIEALDDGKTDFVIGVGNNKSRRSIAERCSVKWTSLIHPCAVVGTNVSIGCGTVVMAGAVINTCTSIGKHCIINTGSIVEHDNIIEDFVHISPGVTLSGTVLVGEGAWIGTGTSVINNVSICKEAIVGVGSVVIRSIEEKGTYYGLISK